MIGQVVHVNENWRKVSSYYPAQCGIVIGAFIKPHIWNILFPDGTTQMFNEHYLAKVPIPCNISVDCNGKTVYEPLADKVGKRFVVSSENGSVWAGKQGVVLWKHHQLWHVRMDDPPVIDDYTYNRFLDFHKDWLIWIEECTCSMEQVYKGCKCGYYQKEKI